MKQKNRWKQMLAFVLVCASLLLSLPLDYVYAAKHASSYTNAQEFYESTGDGTGHHIDVYGGIIYFSTAGKKGSSNSTLKYTSLGFDVTLTANGQSLTFSVKSDASLQRVPGARVETDDYIYHLYHITTADLKRLAFGANEAAATEIFQASYIGVRMDAIMTTSKNGVRNGSIEENGSGGLNETGTVYHLNNPSHLSKMKSIFSGDFKSYIEIEDEFENFKLDITYALGDYTSLNSNYSTGTVTLDGKVYNNNLYTANPYKRVVDTYRIAQSLTLKNPATLDLKKTGYYLPAGAEWKKDNGETFSATATYYPATISSDVANGNDKIVLTANWKPNPYQVIYNANGGQGSMTPSRMYYDDALVALRANTFERTGYTFTGWNTDPYGGGTSYTNLHMVNNMTSVYDETVILYAQWQPCVYKITASVEKGSGGTCEFYEKYENGFYAQEGCTTEIDAITGPTRTGYNFKGYYYSKTGGTQIVNSDGKIVVGNTFFTSDRTIYANWEARQFPVKFDKQGGTQGSDMAIATYDKVYPVVDAPDRNGYTFKGYYTEPGGKGTMVYNENMASDTVFQETNSVTLYAYWVDEVPPEVMLNVSIAGWTNDAVVLTAEASDYGSGLKSLEIYRIEGDGSEVLVSSANLNGVKSKELSITNAKEGIVRYKAVATDVAGQTAESYNVVYYDITSPKETEIKVNITENVFDVEIDITDINTGK